MEEQRIVIISPFWNAEKYIEKCIRSVTAQNYTNYKHILIDDASTDNSYDVACKAIEDIGCEDKIEFVVGSQNMGAVYNQITTIRKYAEPDDIIMLLDGDDSLVNNPEIFNMYNEIFHQGYEYCYGSCWSMVDKIPLIAQEYPPNILKSKAYRSHKFAWNIPYDHPRVFRNYLAEKVPFEKFRDENKKWFRAGGDVAVFYNILEQADPNKIKVIQDVVYNYNDTNPLNDYKVNKDEQTMTANKIIANSDTPIVDSIIKQVIAGDMPSIQDKKTELPFGLSSFVQQSPSIKNIMKPPAKKILIAIPTFKYIDTECFKSIYDQEIPAGYETTFQCFFGNNISQVRNLIADWVVKGFDYLWAVDSDIAFPPDTLKKLLSHDVPLVSGVYIQRIPGTENIELYDLSMRRMSRNNIPDNKLIEIGGCGFGCVLIKKEVITTVGYPQFYWVGSLEHVGDITEDNYFCRKATEKGFKLYADTSVKCRHLGTTEYVVPPLGNFTITKPADSLEQRLRDLGSQQLIPKKHYDYLLHLKNTEGWNPRIIYDIGACVLHWTNMAKFVWADANYYAFDAFDQAEFLYKEQNIPYYIGVLSDKDDKEIDFWQNDFDPGGNGYFKVNKEFVPNIDDILNESHKQKRITKTLDTVVKVENFPMPDLIKMDVQGAEMDILKGAHYTLQHCNDLILELQTVSYNKGAPMAGDVINYLDSIGFKLMGNGAFCPNILNGKSVDGDYHFRKKLAT